MLIKQYLEQPTEAQFDKLANIVVVLSENATGRLQWPDLPYVELLRQRRRKRGEGRWPLSCDLPNRPGTRVVLTSVRANDSPFVLLGKARKAIAMLVADDPRELAVCVAALTPEQAATVAETYVAAALATTHSMPSFKQQKPKPRRLAVMRIYGHRDAGDYARTHAEAEGNNLARYLTALPANQLTPRQYRNWVHALAKQHGWKMQFHDQADLQKRKAGAFLAVAQGSSDNDAGIVHLRYSPARSPRGTALALAGKGICFDTGGTNLKSARHMHHMHHDMAGSAVALGTLLALTQLAVPYSVDCWLALAQNHIGPNAYKQGDVVSAANGVSIEVVHTDAEGRMVLADTLVMAGAAKPGLLLDYATLTGSCIDALGSRYSGAFCSNEALQVEVLRAGHASGERVWPFPNDDDYDEALESQIADIKQCILDNEADHILASRFLSRFVDPEQAWVHLDLSAANHKGGLAHIPTDITGFGVRFSLQLLQQQGLL